MGTPALPKNSDLSSEQLRFLDRHFGASDEDLHLHLLLHKAPNLLTVLHSQCSDLDSDLLRLQARLARCCVSWIPRSFAAKSAAHSLGLRLQNLSLATSSRSYFSHSVSWFSEFVSFRFGFFFFLG